MYVSYNSWHLVPEVNSTWKKGAGVNLDVA